MSIPSSGSRGGEEHKRIVEWVSNNLLYEVASSLGFPFVFVTSSVDGDSEMARTLGTKGQGGRGKGQGQGGAIRKGGYYPDCVWEIDTGKKEFILSIEVGTYRPDRAPSRIPVLHLGLTGGISTINIPPDISKEVAGMAEIIRSLWPKEGRPR